MFDRFIRLAQAQRALARGRPVEAAQLAADPAIAEDRRAVQVRQGAQELLLRRAGEHLEGGREDAAERDLEAALRIGPHEGAADLIEQVRQQSAARQQRVAAQAQELSRRQALAQQGALDPGESPPQSWASEDLAERAQQLDRFVDRRRNEARALVQRAQQAAADGDLAVAVGRVVEARALDRQVAIPWLSSLVRRCGRAAGREVTRQVRAGDYACALDCYRGWQRDLAELVADPGFVRAGRVLAARLLAALAKADVGAPPVDLLELGSSQPQLPLVEGQRLLAGAEAWVRAEQLRDTGDVAGRAAALLRAAEQIGHPGLESEGARLEAQAGEAEVALASARSVIRGGELIAGKQLLQDLLDRWPLHGVARRELQTVEESLRQRQLRLDEISAQADGGRLLAAYRALLALGIRDGDEATAALLKDLRARMDRVESALGEVRVMLHQCPAGGIAGLRHCLERLEQLQSIQSDHEELATLCAGVRLEIDALASLQAADAALEAGDPAEFTAAMQKATEARRGLFREGRLDARLAELVERTVTTAEHALAAGRLSAAARWMDATDQTGAVGEPSPRTARLRERLDTQQARAQELLRKADAAMASKDLVAAEEHAEAAEALWVDGVDAVRLRERLRAVRSEQKGLGSVEELVGGGDLDSARQQMDRIGLGSPLLATRIYDMKRELQRAQGLEGCFVLRVDEGGEFLVFRGESVAIGNVRDGVADMQVLAAIRGRHARIERSMSFHGGMQDSIRAEDGEVSFAGRAVDRRRLQAGDEVQLGSSLRLRYELPCSRSLTAGLRLLGGFSAGGTDRALLLKDRGRDGRVVIGPGRDVHVQVRSATSEVELYSNRSGRMCVRADHGTIDGRPFSGEHPVEAGNCVEAGGVSFVLLPRPAGA